MPEKKKNNSLFLKLNDNESDKISYWVKCQNCKHDIGISTTYKQIHEIYEENSPLSFVCPECNETTYIDIDSLKKTISELPANKKGHLQGYINGLKQNAQAKVENTQQPIYINQGGDDSGSFLAFIIIVAIIIFLVIYFYGDQIKLWLWLKQLGF